MEKFSHYIYFDHSATTPVMPEVAKVVYDTMTLYFGNASESHLFGVRAKHILENSRNIIAKSINCYPDEILFTSGGTESNNIAIFGIAEAYYKKGNHIITTEIEHPAIHMPLRVLEHEGYDITYLPVDGSGIVDPQDVRNAIINKTVLITVMHGNNIMGSIQPIAEIGRIAKENDIIFHSDAVQSYMNANIDVNHLNVDLMSISGHKIYAPKGVGALFIKRGIKIMPQIFGGGQEKGKRSGTENTPGIAGFAKSVEILSSNFSQRIKKTTELRDYLRDGILQKITDVTYNGHPEKRLPGNCNFTFKHLDGSDIVRKLDEYGIAISAGSACKSAAADISDPLLAMGICPEFAKGSIRITLGFENSKEEVDYLTEILPGIVSDLRNSYLSLKEKDSNKYFIF
ncbi:MAG: cysteine desulfurase family protein [Actinomycetota bacterium]|nr:cysteine desulfurase family protein [Actinomycetota bacterium]